MTKRRDKLVLVGAPRVGEAEPQGLTPAQEREYRNMLKLQADHPELVTRCLQNAEWSRQQEAKAYSAYASTPHTDRWYRLRKDKWEAARLDIMLTELSAYRAYVQDNAGRLVREDNWHDFCPEPELSADEKQAYRQVCQEAADNAALYWYIESQDCGHAPHWHDWETAEERRWLTHALYESAYRRWQRRVLKAYQEWAQG